MILFDSKSEINRVGNIPVFFQIKTRGILILGNVLNFVFVYLNILNKYTVRSIKKQRISNFFNCLMSGSDRAVFSKTIFLFASCNNKENINRYNVLLSPLTIQRTSKEHKCMLYP